MKIAWYVHPILQPLGPYFNYLWFQVPARLLHMLRRDANADCMLIAGSRFYQQAKHDVCARLMPGLRVVELDEIDIYRKVKALGVRPMALDSLAYTGDADGQEALQVIADNIARCSEGFKPDIVISMGVQLDFLAAIWPNALRLHVEVGPYSRNPFPWSIFFDHHGIYGRSIISREGKRLRQNRTSSAAGRALARSFRLRNTAALAAINPFQIRELRRRFDHLCLLPLQVSNYYSFDKHTNYSSQFEFLYDTLSQTPREIGLVVTEYLEWGPVFLDRGPGQNLEYLRRTFPNLIFDDSFRSYYYPSQFIVPFVDGVWSVASTVGIQALMHGKLLGAPTTSFLASLADATTLGDFFETLKQHEVSDNDSLLAWQLERYLIPDSFLQDGLWLHDYFERRIAASRDTRDALDAFVPIDTIDNIERAWVNLAPRPAIQKFEIDHGSGPLAEASSAKKQLEAVLHSTSWRITAPMRSAVSALRTLRSDVSQSTIEAIGHGKPLVDTHQEDLYDTLAQCGKYLSAWNSK